MLVESWQHLEGQIRVTIMSHNRSQLPAIMSRDRHAMIADGLTTGDEAAAIEIVEQHMTTAAGVYVSGDRSP